MKQVRYEEPEMEIINLFRNDVYTDGIIQASGAPTIDGTDGSDYDNFFG